MARSDVSVEVEYVDSIGQGVADENGCCRGFRRDRFYLLRSVDREEDFWEKRPRPGNDRLGYGNGGKCMLGSVIELLLLLCFSRRELPRSRQETQAPPAISLNLQLRL